MSHVCAYVQMPLRQAVRWLLIRIPVCEPIYAVHIVESGGFVKPRQKCKYERNLMHFRAYYSKINRLPTSGRRNKGFIYSKVLHKQVNTVVFSISGHFSMKWPPVWRFVMVILMSVVVTKKLYTNKSGRNAGIVVTSLRISKRSPPYRVGLLICLL